MAALCRFQPAGNKGVKFEKGAGQGGVLCFIPPTLF